MKVKMGDNKKLCEMWVHTKNIMNGVRYVYTEKSKQELHRIDNN